MFVAVFSSTIAPSPSISPQGIGVSFSLRAVTYVLLRNSDNLCALSEAYEYVLLFGCFFVLLYSTICYLATVRKKR